MFTIEVVILSAEKEEDYRWALNCLNELYGHIQASSLITIVTDEDLALAKAIQEVLPRSHHVLCRWHMEKNILFKCKRIIITPFGYREDS